MRLSTFVSGRPAMLFAVAAGVAVVLHAVMQNVGIPAAFDLHGSGTYYVVVHSKTNALSAAMFYAICSAVYVLWPIITHRPLNVRLGQWHFALTIAGAIAGWPALRFAIACYGKGMPMFDVVNGIVSIVSIAGALSTLLLVANLAISLSRPRAQHHPSPNE